VSRREYKIDKIQVNRVLIDKVIIDSHYEEKHSEYMNDDLILELVAKLDERIEVPEETDDEFSYFATLIQHSSKQYRLI